MSEKEIKANLPCEGIWTIEDLANYIDITPAVLEEELTARGVFVMRVGKFHRHRLISLADLCSKMGNKKHAVVEEART